MEQATPEQCYFMEQAFEMARKALDTGETPVGCVLVYGNKVVGYGMNDTNRSMNGTRHAEFVAIQEMLRSYPKSVLRSTDLYVTVEPCVMCASALRQYQIRSVYFGCGNERFGGTGSILSLNYDRAIDPPYPVFGGLQRKEAIMLLRRFYIQENEKAPKPRPKKNRELNTKFEDECDSTTEESRKDNAK
ncbi:cytidine deaminase-like protein [Aspergillus egyptiacus]|nr:cytidine deaminase-like protein [Aspergillus egyptiacus]